MKRDLTPTRLQAGSFMLEALIAILIVALGILGSVGLLARSLQETGDARNRAEAAALANGLITDMWLTDRLTTNLQANYNSDPGTGAGYTEFKDLVAARLPNTAATPPVVDVQSGPIVPANPALQTNSMVTITITWQPPGDTVTHKYDVMASIGANQ
ncbi:MAG: hypothetical protein IT522_06570 [Burkholderiales bacterium]|nr:hypothetical protein [Burkholderiales bacterium]